MQPQSALKGKSIISSHLRVEVEWKMRCSKAQRKRCMEMDLCGGSVIKQQLNAMFKWRRRIVLHVSLSVDQEGRHNPHQRRDGNKVQLQRVNSRLNHRAKSNISYFQRGAIFIDGEEEEPSGMGLNVRHDDCEPPLLGASKSFISIVS